MKLLKSEFGANLADAIDALMLPPSVQDARTLHEAMKVGLFAFQMHYIHCANQTSWLNFINNRPLFADVTLMLLLRCGDTQSNISKQNYSRSTSNETM